VLVDENVALKKTAATAAEELAHVKVDLGD